MWDYTRILKTQDNINPNNPALADPNFGANLVSKNDGTLAFVFTVDATANVNFSQASVSSFSSGKSPFSLKNTKQVAKAVRLLPSMNG